MASPYTPVTWLGNEPADVVKLAQMANNEQALYENTVRAIHRVDGSSAKQQIAILTGSVNVGTRSKSKVGTVPIYFKGIFGGTVGLAPVVVGTPQHSLTLDALVTVSTIELDSSHARFRVQEYRPGASSDSLNDSSLCVNWIAIGVYADSNSFDL